MWLAWTGFCLNLGGLPFRLGLHIEISQVSSFNTCFNMSQLLGDLTIKINTSELVTKFGGSRQAFWILELWTDAWNLGSWRELCWLTCNWIMTWPFSLKKITSLPTEGDVQSKLSTWTKKSQKCIGRLGRTWKNLCQRSNALTISPESGYPTPRFSGAFQVLSDGQPWNINESHSWNIATFPSGNLT